VAPSRLQPGALDEGELRRAAQESLNEKIQKRLMQQKLNKLHNDFSVKSLGVPSQVVKNILEFRRSSQSSNSSNKAVVSRKATGPGGEGQQ